MVPVLVQQGYQAIAVAFDYWGLASLVKDSLNKGRELVKQAVAGMETP
jgi:4-hydroxy-2-oxoheptanedioate aldolase